MDLLGFVGDLAGNIVSSLFGYNINSHQQNKQNDFNLQLYKMQREDSLADRAHMEAYNSPKNQMALYRQGGLNPNLVYTQMGSPTTSLPNKVTAEGAASYSPYKMSLPSLQQAMVTQENIRNIREDTNLKSAQKDYYNQKAKTEQEQTNYIARKVEDLSYEVQRKGFESVYYEQMAYAKWLMSGYKASTAGYISDYWKERADKAVQEVAAGIKLAQAQGRYFDNKALSEMAQIAVSRALAGFYNEKTETQKQLTKQEKERVEVAKEEINKIILQNGIAGITFQTLEEKLPYVSAREIISILGEIVDMGTDIYPPTKTVKSIK